MAMGSPAFSPPEMLMATRNEGASYDGASPLPPPLPSSFKHQSHHPYLVNPSSALRSRRKLSNTHQVKHHIEACSNLGHDSSRSAAFTPLSTLRAAAFPSRFLKVQCRVFIG